MALTVVVHSFVADSSLLDSCDLVVFFSTLCLQLGHRLRFWGGFSCFVSFIWCQQFACLIKAAIFRLPPRFVVWSFFLCHRRLWSVLSFFVIGICVQFLSYTAFSAVAIRAWLSVFAFFLSECPQMLKSILGANCDVDRLVPWLRRGPVRVPIFFTSN